MRDLVILTVAATMLPIVCMSRDLKRSRTDGIHLGPAYACGTPFGRFPEHANNAIHIVIDGYDITSEPTDRITVRGHDLMRRPWVVNMQWPAGYDCYAFSADITGSGRKDLIVVNDTGSEGGSYSSVLTIISLDDEGRPVPWQGDGPFKVVNGDTILGLQREQGGDIGIAITHKAPFNTGRQRTVYRLTHAGYVLLEPEKEFVDGSAKQERIDNSNLTNDPGDQRAVAAVKKYRNMPPLIIVTDGQDGSRVIDLNTGIVKSGGEMTDVGVSCDTGCRPFVRWVREASTTESISNPIPRAQAEHR